jgi:3-carboxy-cis,cis-muconate cycloisomerase
MPSTAIDSAIFGDIFGTEEMRRIFSDQSLVQYYLDVEAALATVQAKLGIIPQEAADEIKAKARFEAIDFDEYSRGVEKIGYPILPLVQQIVKVTRDGLGEYSHWGATTQDIMDTALVMQLREAFGLIEKDMSNISGALADLASKHRDTAMTGRSQLQQALPITFGYKAAVWLSAIERHRKRLDELLPRLLVGQFGGAVGTLASLGKDGLKVQKALCEELNLGVPDITWHSVRDNLAEALNFLAILTGTLAKIGTDILLMAQTEVGEANEPYAPGRGASSTMPQKRNPISSQRLIIAAKVVRQNAASMMEAMVQDHERASGPWAMEWLLIPDAFILSGGALSQASFLTKGLEINPENMNKNLGITNGLIVSEAVMMGLAPHIGRQRAHDLVHEAVLDAIAQKVTLYEVLSTLPEIINHISLERLAELVDPQNYTGLAGEMVDNLLAQL